MKTIKIQNHYEGYQNEIFSSKVIPSGFSLTFENGNTISVQFGLGNYCKNRYRSMPESNNAEIAIWDASNNWHTFDGDQVKGWCDANEIAEWIHFAANNKIQP